MKITLNGELLTLTPAVNINTLLSSHGYKDKLVAVAVNGSFIARSFYDDCVIQDQDEVEIVAPMQGG